MDAKILTASEVEAIENSAIQRMYKRIRMYTLTGNWRKIWVQIRKMNRSLRVAKVITKFATANSNQITNLK